MKEGFDDVVARVWRDVHVGLFSILFVPSASQCEVNTAVEMIWYKWYQYKLVHLQRHSL